MRLAMTGPSKEFAVQNTRAMIRHIKNDTAIRQSANTCDPHGVSQRRNDVDYEFKYVDDKS